MTIDVELHHGLGGNVLSGVQYSVHNVLIESRKQDDVISVVSSALHILTLMISGSKVSSRWTFFPCSFIALKFSQVTYLMSQRRRFFPPNFLNNTRGVSWVENFALN
jgi:hypothetical protein